MSDLFVDRLGNITVTNGVARLDLMRQSALNPETQQTRLDISQRLVIPVEELMQALEMLNKIRDELHKQPPAAAVEGAAQNEDLDRLQ